jgi:murein L,D-transpeptidase YcbB/YkuD
MKLFTQKTFPYLKSFFLLLCLPFLMLAQCRRKELKVERDITITPKNAVTRLLIDSLQMEQFISMQKLEDSSANRLRNFYNSRNFQFAWLAENGLAEQAKVFYELDKNYISTTRDSTDADQALHGKLAILLGKDTLIRSVSPALVNLELTLTQHFFSFINYAYAGKLDPAALQWYIPRRKLDVVALLDSLIAGKGTRLENWEPVNRYHKKLNNELIRWYRIQKKGPWEKISTGRKSVYLPGDTGLIITRIKQRLADFGALSPGDTTPVFNDLLSAAVKKAQKQFGFTQSGKIDRTLIAALNIPAEVRIQQMLINLERMKWTPLIPESKFILVNIPEYKLHVFESGKEVLNMGIVVGKAASKTVIFSNELKNIVFSPYWNIPPSIVRTEILPEIRKNRDYLAEKNMEQYDTSDGLPQIRQKPGNMNSLGRVKFLFPNSYNIYLHDTPSKSLFAEEKRAFSHGCIRLAQPKKLAEYLLADQPEWTSAKIDKAMNSKTEIWVNMKQPVPVFITYFTSWVDKDGLLNFRDDLYGHDRAMSKQMFKPIESKK